MQQELLISEQILGRRFMICRELLTAISSPHFRNIIKISKIHKRRQEGIQETPTKGDKVEVVE